MGTNYHTPWDTGTKWTPEDTNPAFAELDKVLTYMKRPIVHCDGDIAWSKITGILSWTGNLRLLFTTEAGNLVENYVAAGSLEVADGQFAYVDLNEVNGTALTMLAATASTGVASTIKTFNRVVLGLRNTTSDEFYPVALPMASATASGPSGSELEELVDKVNYAKNIIVHCDGDVTYGNGDGSVAWSGTLRILFTNVDGNVVQNTIATGNATLADNEMAYVDLSDTNNAVLTVSTFAIVLGDPSALAQSNKLVLAYRNTASDRVVPVALPPDVSASAFTDLTDGPGAYTDHGGEMVTVKDDETGLEYTSIPPVWYNGTDAPGEALGKDNDYYLNNSSGAVFQKLTGTWTQIAQIIGEQGEDGHGILNGAGVPSEGTGTDGDFYIDTTNWDIYGPKTSGVWGEGTGMVGYTGQDGKTILNGSGAPGAVGVVGDFYIDTTNWDIYGPKVEGGWGDPTTIVGPAGPDGSKWYVGTGVPSDALGNNNDMYLRTTTSDVYQKAADTWGSPVANVAGAPGVPGDNGADGAKWYQGSTAPSDVIGVDGDYYLRTATNDVYQKDAGTWGSPIANLKGDTGAAGNTILYGYGAPSEGLGTNGNFYVDNTNHVFYGPKTLGSWSYFSISLIGPGMPSGGTASQKLRKKSATDYDTEWVDDIAVFVTVTVKENVVKGNLLCLKAAGFYKADYSNIADCKCILLAMANASANATVTAMMRGKYTEAADLIAGDSIYVGATGAMTQTAPSTSGQIIKCVAYAISATEFLFNPDSLAVEIP